MISIQVSGEFIDLDSRASFSLSASSPFFTRDSIPGSKIYNISAQITPLNQRVFGFSEKIDNSNRGKLFEDVRVFFSGQLWKVGTFKLRDVSDAYNFSFHTDSGDIQLKIQNKSMPGADLGTGAIELNTSEIYPVANHVFFPVDAINFYGENGEVNSNFGGVINDYDAVNGRLLNSQIDGDEYAIVPYPYLLYVLERLFQSLGYYGLEGDWIENENIRRVVIYNNTDLEHLDLAIDSITYNRHIANVGIGSFLIDVAIFFGVVPQINPVTKRVAMVEIKEWLTDPNYKDWNSVASRAFKIEPNQSDGFKFELTPDSGDSLYDKDPDWKNLVIGNGAEVITAQVGIMEMITTVRAATGGEWTIPHTLQTGVSEAYELGIDNRSALRFMLFNGLVNDSLGNAYPQGHVLRPGFSLRLDGVDGIVERCYSEYVEWKTYSELVERTIDLSISELMRFDFKNKVMADEMKWLIEEYKASVNKDGLKATSVKMWKVKN